MLYNVPIAASLASGISFRQRSRRGFIYKLGHTMVWSGWQGDQPIASVNTATQEGIDVPIASVTSVTWQRFANGCRDCVAIPAPTGTPPAKATTLQISGLGRTAASFDTTKATLISATSETQDGKRGGVVTIASTDWAFADCRTVPFPGTPDANLVCLKDGFDRNLHQLVYVAKDPFVLGVGWPRCATSFLPLPGQGRRRHRESLAGAIKYVIGSGTLSRGASRKINVNLGSMRTRMARSSGTACGPSARARRVIQSARAAGNIADRLAGW